MNEYSMGLVLRYFRKHPVIRTVALLSGSLAALVGFLVLPLLYLFIVSFAQRSPEGLIEWTFGVTNYARAFQPVYLEIYMRSLLMALLTTGLCILLGYPVAYTIALRVPPRWKSALLLLVVVPFWTSFLIRTYAWMVIFRTEGVINAVLQSTHLVEQPVRLLYTPFAVLVGLVYGELPFMILPLYAVLEKMDRSLLEAAEDLGANRTTAFMRITLPLSVPGLVAGAVLVFIPSVGAFITPDLLGGARTMMAGNLIQNQFAVVRDQPFGSAVAFLLTACVLAVLLASVRNVRSVRGESSP